MIQFLGLSNVQNGNWAVCNWCRLKRICGENVMRKASLIGCEGLIVEVDKTNTEKQNITEITGSRVFGAYSG